MIKKLSVFIVVIAVLGFVFCINHLLHKEKDIDLNLKYSNCEIGDLVGDDVERIVYKNFNLDYHTNDFEKSQIEDFAQKCLDEGIKNQYQMDCCIRSKMIPDD